MLACRNYSTLLKCKPLPRRTKVRRAITPISVLLVLIYSVATWPSASNTPVNTRFSVNWSESSSELHIIVQQSRNHGNVSQLVQAVSALESKNLQKWLGWRDEKCGGAWQAFGRQCAHMQNVTMLLSRSDAIRSPLVTRKTYRVEFYQLQPQFLRMTCNESIQYRFDPLDENELNKVLNSLVTNKSTHTTLLNATASVETRPTIMVQRQDYVNLFHTITDWYNAFLTMVLFRLQPDQVQVLFLDAHPSGILDASWSKLFNKVVRLHQLPEPIVFRSLALSIWSYQSQMFKPGDDSLPLVEPFRNFFLLSHGLRTELHYSLNCSEPHVTFIQRREYAARRADPIGRLIANEDALLVNLRLSLSQLTHGRGVLKGVHLEELTMEEQLRLVARTDVLMGMHGAGLSHSVFLPPHASLIELFPRMVNYEQTQFFKLFAKWRGVRYVSWRNQRDSNDLANGRTLVLVDEIEALLRETLQQMCSSFS